MTYRDAMGLSSKERTALYLAIAEAKGGVIDWENNRVDWPLPEVDDD